MRKIIVALVLLVVAAILLGVASFRYGDSQTQSQFFSSLSLNLVAELFGVFLTLLSALIVALAYAQNRLESLAIPIAKLVAQLRRDGTLSPEAARRSMVCAVKLITPEAISEKAKTANEPLGLSNRPCDVCALETTVGKGRPCKNCGLEDYIWSLQNEPVPTASTAKTNLN